MGMSVYVIKFQVEYLGLKENIRVRRAGFAYRRPFEKFLHRFEPKKIILYCFPTNYSQYYFFQVRPPDQGDLALLAGGRQAGGPARAEVFNFPEKIIQIKIELCFLKKHFRSVNMNQDEYQMGKTKLFIKAPESVRN